MPEATVSYWHTTTCHSPPPHTVCRSRFLCIWFRQVQGIKKLINTEYWLITYYATRCVRHSICKLYVYARLDARDNVAQKVNCQSCDLEVKMSPDKNRLLRVTKKSFPFK